MSKRTGLLISLAFLLAFGVLMYVSFQGMSTHRVEVCMEFHGREACRTASASTRDQALRTATDNACAQISSGMTDSIACTQSMPKNVKWLN
jgi:hypothetical protein